MYWLAFVMGLVVATASSAESTQFFINCGASKGWAYYFPNALGVAEGWTEDGISKGAFTLTVDENGKADMLVKDAAGMMSMTAEGFNVSIVDVSGSYITVLANYPGAAKEMYTFDVAGKKAVWSQHKFGMPIDKAQTMIADCQ